MHLGIDLGGTKIEAIVINTKGVEVFRKRIASPRGCYAKTLDALAGLFNVAQKGTGTILSVGLGIPGSLSPQTGLVRNANSTWLIGEALQSDLSEKLGMSVVIANDADCFTLSEACDGAAATKTCVLGLILGTGVGGGLCIGQQIISGPNRITGEWGHNPITGLGPGEASRDCYCGRQNCIETFLSGPGLARSYQEITRDSAIKSEDLVRDMRNGHVQAIACFNRYLDLLGRALATPINILDPDAIVIGGGLSNIDELYSQLPNAVLPHIFSDTFETPILKAMHGDASGVRGAAWLGMQAD
jgi:fructokinase